MGSGICVDRLLCTAKLDDVDICGPRHLWVLLDSDTCGLRYFWTQHLFALVGSGTCLPRPLCAKELLEYGIYGLSHLSAPAHMSHCICGLRYLWTVLSFSPAILRSQ